MFTLQQGLDFSKFISDFTLIISCGNCNRHGRIQLLLQQIREYRWPLGPACSIVSGATITHYCATIINVPPWVFSLKLTDWTRQWFCMSFKVKPAARYLQALGKWPHCVWTRWIAQCNLPYLCRGRTRNTYPSIQTSSSPWPSPVSTPWPQRHQSPPV